MGVLQVQVKRSGDEVVLSLSGDFDEEAKPVWPDLNGVRTVVFELGKLEHINSVGIRTWIQFNRSLRKDIAVRMTGVPKLIIDQMNVVEGFLPRGAVVESFQVPYYCDKCGRTDVRTLAKGKDYRLASASDEAVVNAPEARCGEFQCEMEPDVFPEKYYRFLQWRG